MKIKKRLQAPKLLTLAAMIDNDAVCCGAFVRLWHLADIYWHLADTLLTARNVPFWG